MKKGLIENMENSRAMTLKERWEWFRYDIKMSRTYYLFLLPYALVFITFFILPVAISIWYSFTYYNIFEPAKFVGLQNYTNLLLGDDVFLKAVTNTLLMAVITGPVGYLMAFIFAWFIHGLPRFLRAFAVLIFYAPTISGNVFMIWSLIFSGDQYGYINAMGRNMGLISGQPKYFLTDPTFMMPVILIVILWMSLGNGFLSFVAGLHTIDRSQYEAGYIDGIRNRWQELWFITLPNMKGMLLFGAVMAITQSFSVADVTRELCGFPSTDYAVHTIVNHLVDYGSLRFDMGYASAIATILFLIMIICNKYIQKGINRIGK
ncbi:MAG: sugar ABC transporter permease [Oscillospiraceae bacterium]|nr:sugar ABC transporter permease [Oscillospiraceae bacterium]